MRIFETEIWIDKYNKWWNGNQEIVNDGVIRLFKINLHYDYNYFIYLKYKDKEEKGYLKRVEGFPLMAIDLNIFDHQIHLKLDNDKDLNLQELYYDEERNAFWHLWYDNEYNSYIPFMLSSKTIQMLQPSIIELDNNLKIQSQDTTFPILLKKYEPHNVIHKGKS
jgi:hypothetical protein